MCTSHKKDVLHPTALSQCHLVPTLEFTWPTNCEFSAKLGVQLDEFHEFTVRPHKCQCLQKGGGGSLCSGLKWDGGMACTKRLFLEKGWRIMLLRYICGEAKFEFELFVMSICISNFFYNVLTDLLTYLIIKHINSQYFDSALKLTLFLVCGWIGWTPQVTSYLNYSIIFLFFLSCHLN